MSKVGTLCGIFALFKRYPEISAFRDLGLSDRGLFWLPRPVISAYAAVISALWGSDLGLCGSDIGLYLYDVTQRFCSTYCVKYRKYYAVYNSAWLVRLVFISGLCFITIFILYSSDLSLFAGC